MGGVGAPGRGVPTAREGPAEQSAADDLGHRLAARQRGEMARRPRGTRAVVDGGTDLHSLVAAWGVGAHAGRGAGAWCRAGHDLPRRHLDPRPPEGGRGGEKGATPEEREEREALGRSRGGYGTKACVIADAAGRAVAFRIAPGQAHELPHAKPLLHPRPGPRAGRTQSRCSTPCPRCRSGSSQTAASAATPSASMSGTSARGQPSRQRCPRLPSPARRGSTTTVTASSASGRASRNGARWRRATRRPPGPSSASCTSPPPSISSGANRAYHYSCTLADLLRYPS